MKDYMVEFRITPNNPNIMQYPIKTTSIELAIKNCRHFYPNSVITNVYMKVL
jgi:hypothetical protein